MTFNWPDIPFSGTEVDAFVVEYKALAEAIMNDMDDDNDVHPVAAFKLKTPYQSKKNLKLYLEYGLLYSAFIVKQRAGNSGPGTDFELGNSPVGPIFGEDQAQDFAERLGCTFTKESIECSFRNSTDPDGDTLMDCANYGANYSSSSYNLCDFFDGYFPPGGEPSPGDPDEPKPCDDFWGDILNKSQQDQEDPNCLAKVLPALVSFLTQIVGGDPALRLMYGLLLHYLNGYGGVMTNSGWNFIGGALADEWIRDASSAWAQVPKKTQYTNASLDDLFNFGFIPGQPVPAHEFNGYTVLLVSSNASAYGVPGGRVWILSTASMIKYPSIKNVLGNYTLVTDGNETIATDPENGHTYISSMSPSNIKQIRDDYDFDDYGWKLLRDLDLPGDDFNDDQIQSGFLYTDDTITPCNAVDQEGTQVGQGFYGGTSRWIVANTHGTGRTVAGDYTDALCKSKHFAIKLTF